MRFSGCCRYRHWPHGQPAGLIRLTGHLMLLAFFSPRHEGPRYLGHTVWLVRRLFLREEEWRKSVSEGFFSFFHFQSQTILVSVNSVLFPGNPVLLRSMLIAVHEEPSCVLALSVPVPPYIMKMTHCTHAGYKVRGADEMEPCRSPTAAPTAHRCRNLCTTRGIVTVYWWIMVFKEVWVTSLALLQVHTHKKETQL